MSPPAFGIDRRVPVVMVHAVGDPAPGWIWPDLACPELLFSRQVARLAEHGYRGASLDDVHAWQARGRAPTERRVVFTFDDGYLDTWVLATPLLERHGLRGLVYVNPDFVEPGETPRPTLRDVWAGRVRREDLVTHGYLNRAEVRALATAGVVDVGSHSRTHTWYPSGPRIVGYHGDGTAAPWLAWNARPERKGAWLMEDQTGFVPLGTPIHEHGRSLGIRRWYPDPAIAAATTAHVAAHGGRDFFARPHWREELDRVAAAADGGTGHHETDAERDRRYIDEIVASRADLAAMAGQPVRHFAWPGGAYDDASWAIAAAEDFLTITVTSRDRARWATPDPRHLRRMGCYDALSLRGRRVKTLDPTFLLWACEMARGRRWLTTPFRVRKALAVLRGDPRA